MDTKKVNKYQVTKNKIEFLTEAHLKQIIEKKFSKVEKIIPFLKNIKKRKILEKLEQNLYPLKFKNFQNYCHHQTG